MKISGILNSAGELLFPEHAVCMGCGEMSGTEKRWLCDECLRRLNALGMNGRRICRRCGAPVYEGECACCAEWPDDGADRVRYAFGYSGPVRGIVHRMKYTGVYRLCGMMASLMVRELGDEYMRSCDIMIPVPMHASRLRERGRNHASVLAGEIAARVGKDSVEGMLTRVRNTGQQAKLNAEQRRKTIIGAFTADDAVKGKSILLIDDVVTTGATINECARALKAAGAVRVTAAAFAGSAGHIENDDDGAASAADLFA